MGSAGFATAILCYLYQITLVKTHIQNHTVYAPNNTHTHTHTHTHTVLGLLRALPPLCSAGIFLSAWLWLCPTFNSPAGILPGLHSLWPAHRSLSTSLSLLYLSITKTLSFLYLPLILSPVVLPLLLAQ